MKRVSITLDKKLNENFLSGKQGSKQQLLSGNRLVRRSTAKITPKGILSPRSPASIRTQRTKYFQSEIDKISKKDQSKDFSNEVQEICQFLISNYQVNLEIIGSDA